MKTIEETALEVAQEMGANIMCKDPVGFALAVHNAWLAQQEPVAWVVKNGLVNYQFANNKQQANALCADLQERHDLSGSLAAFHTVPLFLAPPPAVPEWQPIETAPKDTFLLLCGPSGYTTISFVYATGRMCSDYHAGRWIDHANDDLTDWGFEPTHWQPLPKPPAQGEQK